MSTPDRDSLIKVLTMYQATAEIIKASRIPKKLIPNRKEVLRFLDDLSKSLAGHINQMDILTTEVPNDQQNQVVAASET